MKKHIIAALIISPILAIMAYFATDYIVGEKPHQLQQNNQYELLVKSNCRWESGFCTLANEDVEFKIEYKDRAFFIHSNLVINGVLLAISGNDPVPAQDLGEGVYYYRPVSFDVEQQTLQFSASIGDNNWFYAQAPLTFTKKDPYASDVSY